jgi:hypothetical protein
VSFGEGDTTTTTSQGGLPDYIKPYVTDYLKRASDASKVPYAPYQGQRLADFSGDTKDAFNMIRDTANGGTPVTDSAIHTAQGIAGYQAGTIGATGTSAQSVQAHDVNAVQTNAPDAIHSQDVHTQGIPGADLSAYINPYVNNVLDVQKQRATQSYQEQQSMRDDAAIKAGAFGGSRRFVADSLAQRDMNQQMQDMDAQGLAAAYDNATGLYETDETRRTQVNEGNADRRLNADTTSADMLMRTRMGNADRSLAADSTSAGLDLQARTGNADRRLQSDTNDANRTLQARIANEDARRSGRALGLDAAQLEGVLGAQQQDQRLGLASALSGVGAQESQLKQTGLDTAYNDWKTQQEYPRDMLDWYGGRLTGAPTASNVTTTEQGPAPNPFAQLLGGATDLAALYKLLQT